MIPTGILTAWRNVAPWQQSEQVEQDLILSRILVDIFNHEALSENLLFRGGTALSKLYLPQPVRYSEDLDFVQLKSERIGPVIDRFRRLLKPWLGQVKHEISTHSTHFTCKFQPENQPAVKRTIKVEINTREHFAVYPIEKIPFNVNSEWFNGECTVSTYHIDELAATKLRALYQRRKGRDLFDLFHLLDKNLIDPARVFQALRQYLSFESNRITTDQFRDNLERKLKDKRFLQDTEPLLLPGIEYDPLQAADKVLECIENYWS